MDNILLRHCSLAHLLMARAKKALGVGMANRRHHFPMKLSVMVGAIGLHDALSHRLTLFELAYLQGKASGSF